MSILTVEKLSHGFGGREIFEDVSFRLLKGEHIGLVGANGEGKSTFMKIITNTLEPDQGKIIWSSKVKVGYLDQHTVLEKGLTIEDVREMIYTLFKIKFSYNHVWFITRKKLGLNYGKPFIKYEGRTEEDVKLFKKN